ncbi:serine/threonine kinase [Streptomyces phage Patelgo]|nr:serine/threonine kinase [Streptomyces phage Patelgo]
MSLGSQSEADEIFAFVLRYNAWKQQEDSNYYARRAFEYHAEMVAEYKREQEEIRNGAVVYWPLPNPGPLEVHYPYGPNVAEPTVPDGWKFLAAGISRRAYLAPSGVVYKVMKTPGTDYQGNKGEHETAERVRRSGQVKGAIIPRTALYKVPGCYVIALEFMDGKREDRHWDMGCYYKCICAFPGSPRCSSKIRAELESKLGLYDLHSQNVLWVPSQRAWAVVDLGNG